MPVVEQLGEALADKVRNHSITTVVAPAMGGLVIGHGLHANWEYGLFLWKRKTTPWFCDVDSRSTHVKKSSS